MSTVAQAKRWLLVKRFTILLLIAGFLMLVVQYPRIGAVLDGLTAPQLPVLTASAKTEAVRLDQNWPLELSQQFHSISQGTRTLPIPLSWLLALEAPHRALVGVPFLRAGRFMDDDYILRFGFIKASRNSHNPHGLPVGFATTPGQNLPGVTYSTEAVGFTCAACHTGQLTYGGKRYIVDGGPAPTDLGQLVKALGAALGQTAISAKLPFFNGRFERFAKAVLGDSFSYQREVELQDELDAVVAVLAAQQNDVDVVEGFSRLDALNRIGNQVFAIDSRRPQNYAAINAPVNYPPVWTSGWFEWVQYDGSIMGPLIRNTGEAIGVNANIALTAPIEEGRFGSSVPIPNLAWIEKILAGPPPLPAKSFQGLRAPRWPNSFPKIDMERAKEGRALYNNHCQRCHLPALDSEEIWSQFAQFDYYDQAGKLRRTRDSLLKINTIPLSRIGTDPGQANVLVLRTVDTAGNAGGPFNTHTPGMGLDATVCIGDPQPEPSATAGSPTPAAGEGPPKPTVRWVTAPVTDSRTLSFAKALAGLIQEVNDGWFAQNPGFEALRARHQEHRPNCIRAGAGYRARPLNGMWATAPFLHNGSVPTVYDLLSPVADRPELVQLGGTEFDPVHLGIAQDRELLERARQRRDERYIDGYFILDTKLRGNLNTGHEFSDQWKEAQPKSAPMGVIGPRLTEQQRLSLIEFLKTQ
jgi:hypothetical protein